MRSEIIDDERLGDRKMPHQRLLSPHGLSAIKTSEGFRAETYDDLRPARPYRDGPVLGTLTIGYGHTGRFATPGNSITENVAEDLLVDEIGGFEAAIKRLVKVPLTQGEYDALVSFTYNIGADALARSTLLGMLNAGDYDGAAGQFSRWIYSKGVRLNGLVDRRTAEQAMFQGQTGIVTLLASRAERGLGVGANARPDAIEGEGTVKPMRKSKVGWLSGLGFGGISLTGVSYFLDGIGKMDPRLVMGLAALAFVAIFLIRWHENKILREH